MADDMQQANQGFLARNGITIFLIAVCFIFGSALFLQFYYWGLPNLWNFLLCMSIISFICMAFDRKLALNEMERVPNTLLLFNALFSGGIVSAIARRVFRNKLAAENRAISRLFTITELSGLAGSLLALWFF